jgi:membrane protease YdiL (CAAX protease family)
MNGKKILTIVLVILGGFVFFNVLMGISMYLVFLNVDVNPAVPWFPIPALVLIVVATWLLNRRWDIRLTVPADVPWVRVYAFSFLAMLAAKCIKALEGAYHGTSLEAPALEGVSTVFGLVFLLLVPFFAAVLAEISYRGIMQTRIETLLPLWPTLLILAAINTLSHSQIFGGFTDIGTQWIYLMAMNIGFGYTAWMARSIVPAIVMHVVMNVLFPGSQYLWGPFALGELAAPGIATIAVLAVGLATAAIWLARGVSVARPGGSAPAR